MIFNTPPKVKLSVCIVASKAEKGSLTNFIRTVLNKAGYYVTYWDDIFEARQALLTQNYNVVIIVDEVWPDEYGDKFIQLVNELQFPPGIMRIIDKLDPTSRDHHGKTFYELASMGYTSDMTVTGTPNPAELLKFVAMLAVKNSAG